MSTAQAMAAVDRSMGGGGVGLGPTSGPTAVHTYTVDHAMNEAAAEIINLPAVQPTNEVERRLAMERRAIEVCHERIAYATSQSKAKLAELRAAKTVATATHRAAMQKLDEQASMVRVTCAEEVAIAERLMQMSRAALKEVGE